MPGRISNSASYRYGFNGKEIDSTTYGQGNEYDYGFRIYNPRIGKFLSVDPLAKSYPMLTPYQFSSNDPIWMIDIDGLEGVKFYDVLKGNANLIDWLNDPQTYIQGANWFNKNINPLYALNARLYEIRTGRDYNNPDLPKNRSTAAAEIVVDGVMYASGEKAFMALKGENVLENQMAQNAKALMGKTVISKQLSKNNGNILEVIDNEIDDVVKDGNGIITGRGSLGPNNTLNLWIKTTGTTLKGRGNDVFIALFNKVSSYGEIKSISGVWSKGAMGDNLTTFNNLVKDGKTLEEAALGTFTGKNAQRLGYSKVVFEDVQKINGEYTNVNVLFKK